MSKVINSFADKTEYYLQSRTIKTLLREKGYGKIVSGQRSNPEMDFLPLDFISFV